LSKQQEQWAASHIVLRHVLPQTASYIIISATLAVPGFIVAESVLSLIGLIQQPDPLGEYAITGNNASILVLQPWLIRRVDYPHSVSF